MDSENKSNEIQEVDIESKKQLVIAALKERIVELETVLPRDIFDFNDFYFAGGCIYSIWHDKEPKDYDIFCKSKKAIEKLKRYFTDNKGKANIVTKNAISMGKYQFVIKHIGKPDVEVGKFDFKHNMAYYDSGGLVAVSDWNYINDNKLVFNSKRARDVLNIISRIPKFVNRGMEISQSEIFDILEMGTRPTRIFGERASVKKSRSGKSRY